MPVRPTLTEEEYLAQLERAADLVAQRELRELELERSLRQGARILPSLPTFQPSSFSIPAGHRSVEPVQQEGQADLRVARQPVTAATVAPVPSNVPAPVEFRPTLPPQPLQLLEPADPRVARQPDSAAAVWSAPAAVDCPPVVCPGCPSAAPCPPMVCAPCNTQVMVGGQQPGVAPPPVCPERDQQPHAAAFMGALVGGLITILLLVLYHLVRLVRR
jgi:hypothetical protein